MTNMLRFLFSLFLVLEQVSVDSEIFNFSRHPLVNPSLAPFLETFAAEEKQTSR